MANKAVFLGHYCPIPLPISIKTLKFTYSLGLTSKDIVSL